MNIAEFQKVLKKQGIHLAVFLNSSYSKKDPSIEYFAGVDVEFCSLAIPARGRAALFIPGFEFERVRKKTSLHCIQPKTDLWKTVKKEYPRARIIGINADVLSMNEGRVLKKYFSSFKDVATDVYMLRSVKTREEVKRIEKSVKLTERLFEEVLKKLSKKEFHSEKEIADYMLKRTIDEGSEPAFPPIVASGKNAALPHHEPSDTLLRGFLVIDYGVKKNGYCADITRTLYLGTPSRKEREAYDAVLRSQKKALAMVKEGVTLKQVDDTARKEFGQLSKFFIHNIGHSLGLEVHDDLPRRKKRLQTLLKEGMVITVEPGVYEKNKYGIRIEDDVFVTRGGHKNLVKIGKELKYITT